MSTSQQQIDWSRIIEAAGPYPLEAYDFVRDGLSYTSQQVHGEPDELPELDRHVSGQQLCLGLREFAIRRYGLLAPIVLDHWHIRRTDDFGRIVFAMIGAGMLSRTDEDSLEDFRGVFDFAESFSRHELVSHLGRN